MSDEKSLGKAIGNAIDKAFRDLKLAEHKWMKHEAPLGVVVEVARTLALHIHAQDRRIAALESAGTISYEGVAEAGREYEKGMFVTHQGSLWHCNYKTISQPGFGKAWTLAVKRGKDARDVR